MDMETAKKYLPRGKTHPVEEQMSDEELARWVDALFIKNRNMEFQTEKEEAIHYLMEIEVAYQVIKRLAGEKRIPALIQSETDWNRYFQFQNPNEP